MENADENDQVSNVGIPPGTEGVSATDNLDGIVEAIMNNIEKEATGKESERNASIRKQK